MRQGGGDLLDDPRAESAHPLDGGEREPRSLVDVALPLPIHRTFTYACEGPAPAPSPRAKNERSTRPGSARA